MYSFVDEEPLWFENFDLDNIVTQVNADRLEQLLIESKYNTQETEFLGNRFKYGFPIGYKGDESVKLTSPNLKLTVGSEVIL